MLPQALGLVFYIATGLVNTQMKKQRPEFHLPPPLIVDPLEWQQDRLQRLRIDSENPIVKLCPSKVDASAIRATALQTQTEKSKRKCPPSGRQKSIATAMIDQSSLPALNEEEEVLWLRLKCCYYNGNCILQ